jgi:hypothetical protein
LVADKLTRRVRQFCEDIYAVLFLGALWFRVPVIAVGKLDDPLLASRAIAGRKCFMIVILSFERTMLNPWPKSTPVAPTNEERFFS